MTPWTVACQSSVHGILQARILELPFPSPGDLPDPGIKPRFPALQVDSLLSEPPASILYLPLNLLVDLFKNIDYRYSSFRAASSYQANQRARTEERAFEDHPVLSLVAQMVKNLPPMLETWVQSLGWEDRLGEDTATHSGILVWRTPLPEKPGGLWSIELQRVGHD